MLTVKRVKQLINDNSISDDETEEIRDGYRALAEIIFEQWQAGRLKNEPTKNKYENRNKCD